MFAFCYLLILPLHDVPESKSVKVAKRLAYRFVKSFERSDSYLTLLCVPRVSFEVPTHDDKVIFAKKEKNV